MSTSSYTAGKEAFLAGVPFDEHECADWQEGWDEAWQEEMECPDMSHAEIIEGVTNPADYGY